MDVNVATKEANGAWKENSFLFRSEKACSTSKKFVSQIDSNGLGFNFTCPITQVSYTYKLLLSSSYLVQIVENC